MSALMRAKRCSSDIWVSMRNLGRLGHRWWFVEDYPVKNEGGREGGKEGGREGGMEGGRDAEYQSRHVHKYTHPPSLPPSPPPPPKRTA